MIEVYRFPANFFPLWHLGARIALGPYRNFLRRAHRAGKERLLDIGAGGGWHSLVAALHGMRVTSCDISEDSLRNIVSVAQKMHVEERITTLAADCCALPVKNESQDIVIASHIIEHLDHPGQLLREIHRVLRPNGVLFLSCPSESRYMRISLWFGMKFDPPDHKVSGYGREEIAAMLPDDMEIRRVFYQGRWIESNIMDLQALASILTGIRANPVNGTRPAPSDTPLVRMASVLKEFILLPLIAAGALENKAGSIYRGSILNCEIEKTEMCRDKLL